MNVFLLAAGEGTRFRPYTQQLPKPMIPFCGVPLIHYSLFLARILRPQKVIINTFHLPEKIHQERESLMSPAFELLFSDEQPILLGSGGGIAKAKKYLGEKDGFLAMNADEVIIPSNEKVLSEFLTMAQASDCLATLLVMQHPEAGKKFGAVWVTSRGEVKGFGKTSPPWHEELTPYHFIGPMYFKKKIFSYLKLEPSNILHDCLNQAMERGESVGVFPIACDWFETGNLKDYLVATESFLNLLHKNESPFIQEWKKEFLFDWELIKSDKALILKHRSAVVDRLSHIDGFAVLGPNTKVHPQAYLRRVVCAQNVNLSEALQYQDELFFH